MTCDLNLSSNPTGAFDLNDPQLDPITADVSSPFTLNFYETNDDAILQVNPIDSNLVYESQADIIYARVENASGFCMGISEINLVVNPLPELYEDIIEDDPYLICNDGLDQIELFALKEPQDPLAIYTYTWFDASGNVVGNSESLTTKSSGKFEAFVEKLYPGTTSSCLAIRTVFIEYSSVAQIETVVVDDLSNNNSISLTVSGEGNYTYAINQGLFLSPDSDTPFQFQFTNVPAGIQTVRVKDIKNDCGTIELEVAVIGFPKFMTPNANNKNDTWNVLGLSTNNQKSTTISIFDRYGKLLTSFRADQIGWDGTYKGKPLAANDYWYLVKLYNGKIYRGHFTLVR
jgi:gliding motility-associated-like protein